MLTNRSSNGLTLIEVVIVLALSALIFGLIFLAFPIAQRERRNAQRKEYLHEVAANVEKYKESAANNFQYPCQDNTAGCPVLSSKSFRTNFGINGPNNIYHVTGNLGDRDPLSNTQYGFAGLATPNSTTAAGISYVLGVTTCSGGVAGSGIYTLTIGLEGGGAYCFDNH